MIIALLDVEQLFVFDSPESATAEIEPVDAESVVRKLFDEAGVPYRVEWMRPNRYRKRLFGLVTSIQFGEYRLVPDGPKNSVGLLELLDNHPTAENPSRQGELDALRRTLRASGGDRSPDLDR